MFTKCQWIAGDPTKDDTCKCGAPTIPESPYCETHDAMKSRGRVDMNMDQILSEIAANRKRGKIWAKR